MADNVNQFPDFKKYDFKHDKRYLAIIGEFQTGDIMHVAGALALHNNIDVLVLYDNLEKKDKSVKAIVDLYTGVKYVDSEPKRLRHVTPFYHEAARVLYKWLKDAPDLLKVDVKTIQANSVGTTNEDAASLIKVLQNPYALSEPYLTLTVNNATTVIAKSIYDEEEELGAEGKKLWYERMSNALASDAVDDKAIMLWAEDTAQKLIEGKPRFPPFIEYPDEKNPILLLWFRKSDFEEFRNSTPKGQEQLRKIAADQKYIVVPIGDVFEVVKDYKIEPKHYIGKFFTEPTFQPGGRAAQVTFYRHLMKRFPGGVVQMGPLSGGMDIAALAGIPTVYIEDKTSKISGRMEQWAEAMQLYRRAAPPEEPTAEGFGDLGTIVEALKGLTDDLRNDNTVVYTEKGYKLLKEVKSEIWPPEMGV